MCSQDGLFRSEHARDRAGHLSFWAAQAAERRANLWPRLSRSALFPRRHGPCHGCGEESGDDGGRCRGRPRTCVSRRSGGHSSPVVVLHIFGLSAPPPKQNIFADMRSFSPIFRFLLFLCAGGARLRLAAWTIPGEAHSRSSQPERPFPCGYPRLDRPHSGRRMPEPGRIGRMSHGAVWDLRPMRPPIVEC